MSIFAGLPKQEDTFESLMRNIGFYESYLNNLDTNATEGVLEGLGSMLVGLSDISMRLLMSLKANVFAFHKSLKRSEIREYFEGHMVAVKQLEAMTFNNFMDETIPAPSEMTSRMMPAVESVENLYKELDILNSIQTFSKVMTQVRKGVVRDEPNYGVDLSQLAQFNVMKMKKINAAVASYNANFAGAKQGNNSKRFQDLYASMKEFALVRQKLIGMEFHLQEVNTVLGTMQQANQTLNQVAVTLEKTKDIQTDFMKQLVVSVRNMASMIDIYGTACHAQMAIEHNHVCVLETLQNQLAK